MGRQRRYGEAIEYAQEMLGHRRRLGLHEFSLSCDMVYLGRLYLSTGRFEEAETVLAEAEEIRRRVFPNGNRAIADVQFLRGMSHARRGHPELAEALLTESLPVQEKYGSRRQLLATLESLSSCAAERGDAELLLDYKRRTTVVTRDVHGVDSERAAAADASLAEVLVVQGRPKEAEELLARAIPKLQSGLESPPLLLVQREASTHGAWPRTGSATKLCAAPSPWPNVRPKCSAPVARANSPA